VYSASLDANGVMHSSGIFSSTYGAANAVGGGDGFVRKQILNYNCSCSDLQSLVDEVQTLLNIAPVF